MFLTFCARTVFSVFNCITSAVKPGISGQPGNPASRSSAGARPRRCSMRQTARCCRLTQKLVLRYFPEAQRDHFSKSWAIFVQRDEDRSLREAAHALHLNCRETEWLHLKYQSRTHCIFNFASVSDKFVTRIANSQQFYTSLNIFH